MFLFLYFQVPRVVCMMTMGAAKIVKRPLKTEWCFQTDELIQPRDRGGDEGGVTNNNLDELGFTQGIVQFRQK